MSGLAPSPLDATPSKVLNIRNLPEESTEGDIRAIARRHGEVKRMIYMSRKHQAFVEFSTLEESRRMLEFSLREPIRLGTRVIICQYSNKSEITTPDGQLGPDGSPIKGGLAEGGKVLLVTISQIKYAVDVSCLHQVFTMEAPVDKIVIFVKQGKTQALIQFQSHAAAAAAMARFNHQNIYQGCNNVNIENSFSSHPNFEVPLSFYCVLLSLIDLCLCVGW